MKLLFSFIFFSFLGFFPLQAQNFEAVNISENMEDPNHLETVDLDGNGLDDFIVAGAEKLLWYKNVGNSEFETHSLLDSVQSFWHFSLFDWENDGDMDIFFTTFYLDQRIAWLENDGSGNFTYHLISKTVNNPLYVQPWDLDKDNDVDILVSSSSTDQLYWLKNDGSNNYTPDTIGNFVNHFTIADLHGDNDWDIIFGRAYTGITFSDVRAYQNDGNNNFSLTTLKSGFQIIHEIITEDVNGDGYFDIVVPDYFGDRIVWLKNDGNYGFNTQSVIINNFDGPESIALADVNEDGKKDLITGSYNADEIYYFQGIGSTSSFSFSSGSLLYSGLNTISDLAIGNFDNQNKKDFVHADDGYDEISVWVNNGSQAFTQNRLAYYFNSPRAFDMADLDGDGDQDVAAVSNDGDMVAWMENKGDESFKTHILLTNYEDPYVVRINDLDEDGDMDIIAASHSDDRLTWWKNDGAGNFTMAHISTALNGPRDFWIDDFDGDGDKDIAVMCYWLFSKSGNTGAQWLKNDGNENFTLLEIDEDVRAGRSIRGADMNGDTLLDLVMSSYYYTGSLLRIAANNGNGFTLSAVDALLCEDIEICDYDGDLDNDILAVDFNLDSIYLYENTGNLQFTKHTIGYFHDLYGISPKDFDGDGDIDIVFTTGYSGFTNGSGYEWGIFRNDGTGGLTIEIWSQNLTNIKPIEVFDYEYDGDYDIMLGFDYLDKITLFKNLDINCPLQVDLIANGTTTFCKGDSLQLQASTTDTGVSFQWYRDNVLLQNETSTFLMVDSSGFYRVEIADSACASKSGTIQVSAIPDYVENLFINICQNDSIVVDTLVVKNQGTYTFNYQSQTGCDSTVLMHVSVNDIDTTSITASICAGESFDFNGTILNQSGQYIDTLLNSENCDSIITLQLTVLPVYQQSQTFSICSGDSAFLPSGTWQKAAGIFIDSLQTQLSCDSIWVTNLIVNPSFTLSESLSICQGDSLLIGGVYQNSSGIYIDTLVSQTGCDSTYTTNLTILPHSSSSVNATICQGDSIWLGGAYRKQTGTYSDTLTAANSCDSILSTTLTVLSNSQNTAYLSICHGDSIYLSNSWQKTTGIYNDILLASNGCDSLLTTVLSVNPIKTGNAAISICQGDSVLIAGTWQKITGTYADTLLSSTSCDSILTTNLTVYPNYSSNANLSICIGDSIFLAGAWQKLPGNYVDVYSTSNLCDSIITTQLTVYTVDTSISRTGNTFQANAASAGFQWLDCNQNFAAIPNAINAIFSPISNGSYAVEITQNGCKDTSQCFVVSTIGLFENSAASKISIYPNPSSGIVTIQGKINGLNKQATISILSADGKTLITKEVELINGNIDVTLDLSTYANGQYLIKIRNAETEMNQPIIITK